MRKILLILALLISHLIFASFDEEYKKISEYISSEEFNIETLNSKIKELRQIYANNPNWGLILFEIANILLEDGIQNIYVANYYFEASNWLENHDHPENALRAYHAAIDMHENITNRDTQNGSPELVRIFAAVKPTKFF